MSGQSPLPARPVSLLDRINARQETRSPRGRASPVRLGRSAGLVLLVCLGFLASLGLPRRALAQQAGPVKGAPSPQEFKTPKALRTWLEGLLAKMKSDDKKVVALAHADWIDYEARPKDSMDRQVLLELWKEADALENGALERKERLFFLFKGVDGEAFDAIRQATLKSPPSDGLLSLALESLGRTGRIKVVAQLEPYFRHESEQVRISALSGFLFAVERLEDIALGTGNRPGARAPRILKAFRPRLETFLTEKNPTLRAGGLRGIVLLSPKAAAIPVATLKHLANDPSEEVRGTVARVVNEVPELPLEELMIPMLGEENRHIVSWATMALTRRIEKSIERSRREEALVLLRKHLKTESSLVAKSPRLVFALGEVAYEETRYDRALELFRKAGKLAAEGAFDPPHFMHSAGATARIRAAEMLLALGRKDEARTEVIKAHLDFKAEAQVQFPEKPRLPLHLAVEKLCKLLGDVKLPPKPERYRVNPGAPGQAGG